jgi:hypothetical protein
MDHQLQIIIYCGVALIALFAAIIFLSIRFNDAKQKSALRETLAVNIWQQAEQGFPIFDVLYAVWQTRMWDVRWIVKDGNDLQVGVITSKTTRTVITVGDEQFVIVPRLSWKQSAEMFRVNGEVPTGPAIAEVAWKGWGKRREATYMVPNEKPLTVSVPWRSPWNRKPYRIQQEGKSIGWMMEVGGPSFYVGRSVSLPAEIPLAVKMFILVQGAGGKRS